MKAALRLFIRLALLLLVVAPIAAWFFVKPVRVVAPRVLGMHCADDTLLCVEDSEKLAEASALYAEAVSSVGLTLGPFQAEPRVVFCTTPHCANQFGLGERSAVTVGTVGTVIGPHAWKAYYVRHELIHHLQGERWGIWRRLFMPSWLVEGMAYALSEDPRTTLAEPWQQYRVQFRAWFATVGAANMWQAATRDLSP